MEIPGTSELFEKIAYSFADLSLFENSVTHKSHSNEQRGEAAPDNERLEFLGDAVLDFVISDILMEKYPALSEGALSKIRAGLVSEAGLAEIARELELGRVLLMGKGEEQSGGRKKSSILSDALEALLAAIFLDSRKESGVGEIHRVIGRVFGSRINEAEQIIGSADFKTELQELAQKLYKDTVNYRITGEEGPDHDKIFEAAVIIGERELERGSGRSKKQAEQEAARKSLGILLNNGPGHETSSG